jgi:hypothetical protein
LRHEELIREDREPPALRVQDASHLAERADRVREEEERDEARRR